MVFPHLLDSATDCNISTITHPNSIFRKSFKMFSSVKMGGRRKIYDQKSYLNSPTLYTPSPGMYNIGSIFGS